MKFIDTWELVQQRYLAWWKGENDDRPIVHLVAPKKGVTSLSSWNGWNLVHNLDAPETAISEYERCCGETYFGGEAFPNLWINLGPGVMAAYIGVEPDIREDTVWFETPKTWDLIDEEVVFKSDNEWWNITKGITAKAVEYGNGNYFVGLTDLGGSLDIVSALRGAQQTLFDVIDDFDRIDALLGKINELWFEYYDGLHRIVQSGMTGSSTWMGIWSPKKWYPLQCDLSAMLSPGLFQKLVAPHLQKQCQWLDHSIYHLDGPGELAHLDILLDIPELNGIQWVPGTGEEPVGSRKWEQLYKRVQSRGKLLVLQGVTRQSIGWIMEELSPNGLLLGIECETETEARKILHVIDNKASV
jgi:hypothetical protein